MDVQAEFIKMLVISALVGGLIGIERELKVKTIAGIRTFVLAALLGTIGAYVADAYIIALAFAGVIILATILGLIKNIKIGDIGITTPAAFLITFLIGVLIGRRLYLEGIASAMIVTGILVSKTYLKAFSETLERKEIINALEFGIIAFVLYPVVPDKFIDPWGLINPKFLVFIIIVVASIGFAGFLALRKIGAKRGLPIIGILGGIVSSEATATALSHRVKERENLMHPSLVGILFANTAMLVRNLTIAGIVSLGVMKLMLFPQLAMLTMALCYSYFLKPKEKIEKLEIPLYSPFAIKPSIQFAILFTVVSFIVYLIKDYVGGVYLAAVFGGLVSSAAVTASLASLASIGSLDLSTAASACVISAIGSTFCKILISKISGTKALAKEVSKAVLIVVIAGVIALIIQAFFRIG